MLRFLRKKPALNFSRRFGTLRISEEIQDALGTGKPVVALESTIITHGIPYPDNVNMARDVESILCSNGVVPATTGFVHGNPMVGLEKEHLEFLGSSTGLHKISRRDIPYIMSNKLSGGTTIASTMILAHKAGIPVFATGGLGGVHRGAEVTMDVSADLEELGRTPIGVVCSGPKSILDIEKTMEYLETKGVHVTTYGPEGTNVPGFYTSDSGVPSPFNFQTSEQAAELLYAGQQFGLGNGTVFCIPTPKELEIPRETIDKVIHEAVIEAEQNNIKGKAVTPFLLKRIWETTEGGSLNTNIGFVKNNAIIAAKIAKHLAKLKGNDKVSSAALSNHSIPQHRVISKKVPSSVKTNGTGNTPVQALVVGTLAVDTTCTLQAQGNQLLHTSIPGKVHMSIGGVGHNVALASQAHGAKTRLVTEVGDDPEMVEIVKNLVKLNDLDGISRGVGKRTPRYIAMHDSNGNLVTACADMDDGGNISTEHIRTQIISGKPKVVFFDGNIGTDQKDAVINASKEVSALTGFEPASVPKAKRLAQLPLGCYPNPSIDIVTPNHFELNAMFDAFRDTGHFDVGNWFPIIDKLNLGHDFRLMLENFSQKNPDLKGLSKNGVGQQAIHLLPLIPNIFVKDGQKGVTSFQLVESDRTKMPSSCNRATLWRGNGGLDILIQHFPAVKIDESKIVSVTGAGDTFCGVLLAELAKDPSWLKACDSKKVAVIDSAQQAASLTIQSEQSVAL